MVMIIKKIFISEGTVQQKRFFGHTNQTKYQLRGTVQLQSLISGFALQDPWGAFDNR
jgi:hypothetical protein